MHLHEHCIKDHYTMTHALIVIDVQNDYFTNGALPQWQVEETTGRIIQTIQKAEREGWIIIAVQHISKDENASLFNPNGHGIDLHASVATLLQDKTLIIKHQADAFLDTELAQSLVCKGVTDIHLCGMMTQNCITHTALSPEASPFRVHILAECCTAPTELIHKIAIRALNGRCHVA